MFCCAANAWVHSFSRNVTSHGYIAIRMHLLFTHTHGTSFISVKISTTSHISSCICASRHGYFLQMLYLSAPLVIDNGAAYDCTNVISLIYTLLMISC